MDRVCSLSKLTLTLTGKGGEELLHDVAVRYVEGMKDMEGRKPGPSSILGEKTPSFFNNITVMGTEAEILSTHI